MSIALSQQKQSSKRSISPGVALGRNGVVPGGPGRTCGLRRARSCRTRWRRAPPDPIAAAKTDAAIRRPSRSTVVTGGVQAQGGQDHDRAGAVRPNRDRGRRRRSDPGQLGPASRGPSPRRGHRARGSRRPGTESQARRPPGHARQPRYRHRAAESPRQAARAVDRAVRGRLEVGDRRQCRAPDPRAAQRDQPAARSRRRRRGTHRCERSRTVHKPPAAPAGNGDRRPRRSRRSSPTSN